MLHGEAATADTAGELVAEPAHQRDARLELAMPAFRELLPVGECRRPVMRQGGERRPDFGERDAELLSDTDDREAPQHVALVAPLISARARGADKALLLVEMQRRHGETGALRNFTYSEFPCHFPLYLKLA